MKLTLALSLCVASSAAFAGEPLPLHTSGPRILNSHNEQVLLRGINAASLEWTSNGEGHILDTVTRAVKEWRANIVRVPISQDRWFGMGPEQHDGGAAYRGLVKQVINRIGSLGAYAIFDLHWSDAGVWGQQIGQHVMPDENSVTFWTDAANMFRNDPSVIFDLYNEPHDVTWQVWKNGGLVNDRGPTVRQARSYRTPGMQKLLDTVRAQGANNVVLVGGLDWAYDMSGFLKGYVLSDPNGNGVIYANHDYPFKGDTVAKWLAKMTVATRTIPVIVSEFGNEVRPPSPNRPQGGNRPGAANWIPETLQILKAHHWSWVAWDLHPAAGPRLISDWKYTPTPSFGDPVWIALHSR